MPRTRLKYYFSSLFELIIFSFIASPLAALFMAFQLDTTPSTTNLNDAGNLMMQAIIWIPLTSLPFFLFFAAPYITHLKLHQITSIYRWFIGMTILVLIYPILMHSIKFILLGMLGIYNPVTVVLSAFVTLYVYYGVHTLAIIILSLLIYYWSHR